MKRLIFPIFLLFLSCQKQQDPRFEQVKQFVETRANIKTDLNFKPVSISYFKPYTGFDSSDVISRQMLDAGTFSDSLEHLADLYKFHRPDDTLAQVFRCEYQINNPALNGARQTIEKYFVFSLDGKLLSDLPEYSNNN